jgi:TrmH family RNA methyltransferase
MLSKNQVRFIRGLRLKKNRKSEGLFLAEGKKVVDELLQSDFQLNKLFYTEDYAPPESATAQEVSSRELKSLSSFATPNQVLGVFRIPESGPVAETGIALALDEVNDPGNLGTIIRLCDWFDVPQILCSLNTVDCFNPKVVQASMGSLSRVKINYLDLPDYLSHTNRSIYGTFMEGESLYSTTFDKNAILVMGNEANGISEEVRKLVSKEVSIPQFGKVKSAESLNVAMATAIFLSELRR